MRVFIHNFANIEKGVKCCGKNFIHPMCLKVRFPNLDSSRTISVLAPTSLELKNISVWKTVLSNPWVNNYFTYTNRPNYIFHIFTHSAFITYRAKIHYKYN